VRLTVDAVVAYTVSGAAVTASVRGALCNPSTRAYTRSTPGRRVVRRRPSASIVTPESGDRKVTSASVMTAPFAPYAMACRGATRPDSSRRVSPVTTAG
jgi:hypothetical protein